jgi:hypothetical protein
MMDSDNESTPEEVEGTNTKTKSNKAAAKPTKIAKTDGNDDDSPPEGCMDKVKRMTNNCLQSTGLCCFKIKEKSFISKFEFQITQRQKKFGVDYLELVHRKASQQALKQCLKTAMNDIAVFQKEIDNHDDKIDQKEEDVNREIKPAPSGGGGGGGASGGAPPPKKKKPKAQEKPADDEEMLQEEPSLEAEQEENVTKKKPTKKKQGQGQPSGEAAADPPSQELEELAVEETTPTTTKPKPKRKKSKKAVTAPKEEDLATDDE